MYSVKVINSVSWARQHEEGKSVKYTTWGSVRGDCGHVHHGYTAALHCIRADAAGCRSQGGYTDRHVRCVTGPADLESYDVTRGPGVPLDEPLDEPSLEELDAATEIFDGGVTPTRARARNSVNLGFRGIQEVRVTPTRTRNSRSWFRWRKPFQR